jgi:hypothetical protein
MTEALQDVSDRTELLVYIGIFTVILLVIALVLLIWRDWRAGAVPAELPPSTHEQDIEKIVTAVVDTNVATRQHVSSTVDDIRRDTKTHKRWLQQIAAKLGVRFEDRP